jgi:hypothetical protein
MPDNIGLTSLPFGARSASILSMWSCGYELCRQIKRPGSALSFERDNKFPGASPRASVQFTSYTHSCDILSWQSSYGTSEKYRQ